MMAWHRFRYVRKGYYAYLIIESMVACPRLSPRLSPPVPAPVPACPRVCPRLSPCLSPPVPACPRPCLPPSPRSPTRPQAPMGFAARNREPQPPCPSEGASRMQARPLGPNAAMRMSPAPWALCRNVPVPHS